MIKLDVKVHDGIVTLTDTVDNWLAKTRAARVTTTAKGVRSVVNRIHIVPEVRRPDEELENLVAAALVGDAATGPY